MSLCAHGRPPLTCSKKLKLEWRPSHQQRPPELSRTRVTWARPRHLPQTGKWACMWNYYYLLYLNNHTQVLSPPVLGPPWSRTRRRGGQGLESLCSPILSSFPLLPVLPSSLPCLLSLSLLLFLHLPLPFSLHLHLLLPLSSFPSNSFSGSLQQLVKGRILPGRLDWSGCWWLQGLKEKKTEAQRIGDRERFYMILCWQMNIILYLFKPRKCKRTLGLGTYVSMQDYWFWNMYHSDGGL